MDERLKRLRKKAMSLPLNPGVYLMKNDRGEIIYVGKAKALKNRVSSYFGSQNTHTIKVLKMVSNVEDFDYILTDSEFEALVLECSLIKQHSPKYNILLKDDKGYHYIKISNGQWRKISAAKMIADDGAEYIGPYTSSYAVKQAVDEALKVFRLPQCQKTFPLQSKQRPCLNYFISQCSAPCAGKITQHEYAEAVSEAVDFLRGGSAATLKDLHKRMETAAENLEFEKAARLRDRIAAINKIGEKQKVVSAAVAQQDIFSLAVTAEKACLMVLRFTDGRLYDSEHFIIDLPENLAEARRELLVRYYMMRDRVPPRVTVDELPSERNLLEEWLGKKAGRKVTIAVPQKGRQLELIEMCRSNAAENLALSLGRQGKDTAALDELARLLGLSAPPEYIESYDISHTAGSENVAGMVVFKNGKPFKSAYKKFKIKGFEGQDDCASMAEVLERRFTHYLDEGENDAGFKTLPSLILLDGAQMQVNAVKAVLARMKIDVPVFGMVKDSSHRTRAIASDGGEIAINSKRRAFTLVSTLQEEVHRFAIEYHRKRRSKAGISTKLTTIDCIGEARARALLREFKKMSAIADASVEELKCVKGMNETAAKAVFEAFHSQEET